MQVATVPVHFCTDTVACVYNILTNFSLSSLYLTLSSLSLLGTQLSLSLISSIFLPFINLSSSNFRRSPLPPIALYSFVSRCFQVEWAWSVGFGLNRVECLLPSTSPSLPLEVSILFLVLAIATRGVDVNHRSCFSFSPSPSEASILLLKARRQSW